MKPVAIAILSVVTIVLLGGLALGGIIGYNIITDGGNSADDTPAPETTTSNDPTPTATDPVTNCFDSPPTVGDDPGTTETTINTRPVTSTAIEHRLSNSLLTASNDEIQTTSVNENLSVLARQHAQATAGGQQYEYTIAESCELNTQHVDVLTEDITSPSSASVADSLQNEFTAGELDAIQADHEAVGIGVYLNNGEIHVTVATLTRSN